MTSVLLRTELKEKVVVEDRKEKSHGERVFITEAVGHRQEKGRTERGVELWESSVRDETTLKREMRQQKVLAKEEEDVATLGSEHQEVEDAEPLEIIESVYTEYEAEKLEDIKPVHKEEKTVYWKEESSPVIPLLKEASCFPSKRDITPPPEMTHLTKTEISALETCIPPKEEVMTDKKTLQDGKHKEADVPSTYTEQREVFETEMSICAEDIVPYKEMSCQMEDSIKPTITATHKEVTVPKKPGILKEVTLLKDADTVEEFASQRSMSPPCKETVSPLLEQDLPKTLSKTAVSHPMTDIFPKKEVIPPKKMESSREEIKKSPKAAGKMPLENTVLVVKSTTVLEERPPEEEFVVLKKEVLSPVPSPETTAHRPSKETVVPTKKDTTPALSKAVVPPKEDFAPEEDFPPGEVTLPKKTTQKNKDKVAPTGKSQVTPQKKPLPPKEETIPSSPAQKVEMDSSEEVRAITTKRPPTREDDKKTKKGTQRIDQQTLTKGILLYLSRSG